jgi:hypothetical protein
MPPDLALTTERLVLRRWRDGDRAPYTAMNADPLREETFAIAVPRARRVG